MKSRQTEGGGAGGADAPSQLQEAYITGVHTRRNAR